MRWQHGRFSFVQVSLLVKRSSSLETLSNVDLISKLSLLRVILFYWVRCLISLGFEKLHTKPIILEEILSFYSMRICFTVLKCDPKSHQHIYSQKHLQNDHLYLELVKSCWHQYQLYELQKKGMQIVTWKYQLGMMIYWLLFLSCLEIVKDWFHQWCQCSRILHTRILWLHQRIARLIELKLMWR